MSDDLERNIKYTIDPAIEKAIQKLKELEKQEADVAKEALDGGKAFKESAKKIRDIRKEASDLQSVLRASGHDFNNQASDVEKATRALDAYEDRLKSVQQGGGDLSGDLASSTAGLRGAGDALSGGNFGAAGGVLEVTEAFADLGEFAPRLGAQIQTLGDTMAAGTSAASNLAGGAGQAIAGVTGLSAGTATFAAVALPVVAVLGTLAIALDQYKKGMEAQRAELEAATTALVDTNRAIAEGLTSDDAAAEIERLTALRDAEAQSVSELQGAYDGIQEGLNDALGGIAGSVVGAGIRAFDSREQEIFDALQTSQSAVQGYSAEIARLESALENGSLSANDAVQAEEQLSETREQVNIELQQAQAQLEQSVTRAAQLQSQYADTVENSALQASNAAEVAAVQAEIDRENDSQRLADHGANLESIRNSSHDRIEQLESEFGNLANERQSELASIQTKGNDKLADLQKDYQSKTQDSYSDFTEQLSRSTGDAAKSIKRLAQDISQSLDDATRSNDVEAFLKAQRDGNTKLSRAREDASEKEARQVEDFIKAREKERDVFLEKQAEIRDSIEAEKQQAIQAFNERREALVAQIEAEKEAAQAQIEAAEARFAEQLRREQVRDEQQARLAEVIERQQQEAHDRRLQNMQAEIAAEQAASQAYLASVQRVQQAAANINVNSGGGGGQNPLANFAQNNPFARAAGNVFNQTFNQNNTVGDVATRADVASATAQATRGFFGALNQTLNGALNG